MGFPEVFGCVVAYLVVIVVEPSLLLLLLNGLLNLSVLFLGLAGRDKCTVFVILWLGDHETRSWVFIDSISQLSLGFWFSIIFWHKFEIILHDRDLSLLSRHVIVIDFDLVIKWICLHNRFILLFSNIQLKALVNVLNVCHLFQEIVDKVLLLLRCGIDHVHSLSRARIHISGDSLRLYLHPSCTLLCYVWLWLWLE